MLMAVWLVIPLLLCCKLHFLQCSVWAEMITFPCQHFSLPCQLWNANTINNMLSIWEFLYPLQAPEKALKSLLQRRVNFIFTSYIWDSKPSNQPRLQLALVITSFVYFNTSTTWSFSSSSNNMWCNTFLLFFMFQSIILKAWLPRQS